MRWIGERTREGEVKHQLDGHKEYRVEISRGEWMKVTRRGVIGSPGSADVVSVTCCHCLDSA